MFYIFLLFRDYSSRDKYSRRGEMTPYCDKTKHSVRVSNFEHNFDQHNNKSS